MNAEKLRFGILGAARINERMLPAIAAAAMFFAGGAWNPIAREDRWPMLRAGIIASIVYQMAGGVRASMGYCGCATIDEMKNKAEFVEITAAGIRESHVHDVQITKEAPN